MSGVVVKVRALIAVPDFRRVEVEAKPTVYYRVRTKTASSTHNIERTMRDFQEFQRTWSSLYPGVLGQFSLPSTLSMLVKGQGDASLGERRLVLQRYLQGLATVAAIRPLLAQFLDVDEGTLVERVRNTSVEALASAALNNAEAREAEARRRAEAPGVRVIEDKYAPADPTMRKKGNTISANNRAKRDHAKFMRKHGSLIASLMPQHDRRFDHLADDRARARTTLRLSPASGPANAGSVLPPPPQLGLHLIADNEDAARDQEEKSAAAAAAAPAAGDGGGGGGGDDDAEHGRLKAKASEVAATLKRQSTAALARLKERFGRNGDAAPAAPEPAAPEVPARGRRRGESVARPSVTQDDGAERIVGVAVEDFFGPEYEDGYTYLHVRRGERVLIFGEASDAQWCFARGSTGEEGYLPSSLVDTEAAARRRRSTATRRARSVSPPPAHARFNVPAPRPAPVHERAAPKPAPKPAAAPARQPAPRPAPKPAAASTPRAGKVAALAAMFQQG